MRLVISGCIFGLLLLAFSCCVIAQEVSESVGFDNYPDTVVGKRVAEFIEAYNSGSREKIEEYLKAHMPEETLKRQPLPSLVKAFFSLYQQNGRFEVFDVEEESEFAVLIKVKTEKAGDWLDIKFSVKPEEPHYQRSLGLLPGRPPEANDYRQWDDLPGLLAQIREETDAPSIAIAVVKDGKLHDSAVAGVRRLGDSTQADLADRYHIGSVGKSMTAVMIGKLIEERKIDWNTTIGEVLTDIEMRDEYRDVTVLQLMNHRGGLQSFVDDRQFDRREHGEQSLTPTQQRMSLVKDALNRDPVGPAGQTMEYSNAGYVTLGAMAGKITGETYENLMTRYVFEPLDFQAAGFGWPTSDGRSEQPAGHVKMGSRVRAFDIPSADMGQFMTPAGDMHFSIDDLARYAAFHLNGLAGQPVMLESSILKKLHTPPVDENYAAGWVIQQAPDGSPMHFHNGSLVTFYAAVFLFPKHNAAVVVATNIGMGIEPDVIKAAESIFDKMIRQ